MWMESFLIWSSIFCSILIMRECKSSYFSSNLFNVFSILSIDDLIYPMSEIRTPSFLPSFLLSPFAFLLNAKYAKTILEIVPITLKSDNTISLYSIYESSFLKIFCFTKLIFFTYFSHILFQLIIAQVI